MKNVRHLLGLSGGKDSTALAIYLKNKYPDLNIEYYFCDTGKELKESLQLIDNLEAYLGKKIVRLRAVVDSPYDPFDHFFKHIYNGYLPSVNARWCTKELKLRPFEKFIGTDLVISYVAIRGDENREGYISKRPNIQSIFPFRKNIWSEDVINKVLNNSNISRLASLYQNYFDGHTLDHVLEIINRPISPEFNQSTKLNSLLEINVTTFNKIVLNYLKTTEYPLSSMKEFPLLNNNDNLDINDVIHILEDSGIGMPRYYKEIEFEVNGKKGFYNRTRSGCFFCFFQQKIEWVWLYEQHPDLFRKAMEYEKDEFTWIQGESLEELIKPKRIQKIKGDHLQRFTDKLKKKSDKLLDILYYDNDQSCIICK